MLTKELDELIEELHSRVGPSLEHSPDPVAAEFYGRILEALRDYKYDMRAWSRWLSTRP